MKKLLILSFIGLMGLAYIGCGEEDPGCATDVNCVEPTETPEAE